MSCVQSERPVSRRASRVVRQRGGMESVERIPIFSEDDGDEDPTHAVIIFSAESDFVSICVYPIMKMVLANNS